MALYSRVLLCSKANILLFLKQWNLIWQLCMITVHWSFEILFPLQIWTLYKQETADLVTFTEQILNGKLHFLCSGTDTRKKNRGLQFLFFCTNGCSCILFGKLKCERKYRFFTGMWILSFLVLYRIQPFIVFVISYDFKNTRRGSHQENVFLKRGVIFSQLIS